MSHVVALDYFKADRESAERERRRAIRMADIEARISWLNHDIATWNRDQLRTAERIKIAERVNELMFDDAPEMMNLAETAKRLGVHPRTMAKLARRGDIPVVRIGGRYRVPKQALIEWIAANQRKEVGK